MNAPLDKPTDDRAADDFRDELPADLNAAEHVGQYAFPDNSRRRIPGYIYLGLAALLMVLWAAKHDSSPLVNFGYVLAALVLAAVGVFCITSGWKMKLDEKDALAKASAVVGWPVGHASAQMVWRGLRSRPVWRVLAYSSEEPPRHRAFVVIDAIDGREIEHLVEANPE